MSLTTWSSGVERGVLEPGLGGPVTFQPPLFPHGNSACRVEAVGRFFCHHGAQARSYLFGSEHPEAEVLVQWPVPGHVVEGGEGKRGQTVLVSPTPYVLDQRSPHALTLVTRDDAHLLDVGRTV